MTLRTIESLGSLTGKTVLVRLDLNVPLKDGAITDDGRVRASLDTLNVLLNAGARVVTMSHLGRPDGEPDAKYSLAPVAQRLSELLGKPVCFASDTVGSAAKDAVDSLKAGEIALLENLRFTAAETSKDGDHREKFAKKLAEFGDAFVSDGFGVVHRKQASVFELAQLLPSAAGLLVERELVELVRAGRSRRARLLCRRRLWASSSPWRKRNPAASFTDHPAAEARGIWQASFSAA